MACQNEKERMASENRITASEGGRITSESIEMSLKELEEKNRKLAEENEQLRRKYEEYQRILMPRERLYDRFDVSLKTMDRIIVALFILLGIMLVLGMIASH
ncbi:MAG: hypothetical protein HFG51_03145 [Lachnospiraceae bacterium]|nr:hypothetical protein [Lachnospiraceae bacterium]